MSRFGLVIHGGAAAIHRSEMPVELVERFETALNLALETGYRILEGRGTALDAVVAAIKSLEDCPLFNAARGAVMNADGLCELDASIMDGRTLGAGAVSGLQRIRNPIGLARDVMEKSSHVMLTGAGAERFAQELGYTLVPNEYFQTDWRRKQLQKAKDAEQQSSPHRLVTVDDNDGIAAEKWGTVGCAALDSEGHLAAGTSTGGMTNKKFGRVGDSPIIGAGTYANDATCALSATGQGEYFIRSVLGHDVSAQMEYKACSLAQAAAGSLEKIKQLGGNGGLVAIDRQGEITLPFTTAGMYRGFAVSDGRRGVGLFQSIPG
jgi:beta-aspartyl-peptidase (threonine type)